MKTQRIVEILKSGVVDTDIVVKGWVRTKRGNKNVAFIALNDGSCVANIQVVVDLSRIRAKTMRQTITTGACIRVDGRLVESLGEGQGSRCRPAKIEVYGTADPATYPLPEEGPLARVPARHRLPASANQYLRRRVAHPPRHGLRHSQVSSTNAVSITGIRR